MKKKWNNERNTIMKEMNWANVLINRVMSCDIIYRLLYMVMIMNMWMILLLVMIIQRNILIMREIEILWIMEK